MAALLYRIAGFFEGKNFHKLSLSRFSRGNFHELSITLSDYYIILTPANAIIIINNSILCLPVWQSLSKWSPL